MKEVSWKPLVKDEQLAMDIVAGMTYSHLSLRIGNDIATQPPELSTEIVETSHFFRKIFNESLGIQLGLPLFFEASTADAKRSRLLKFLS
jgi:hypothetical protein